MKPIQLYLDFLFNMLSIFGPLIFLTDLDIVTKAIIAFYLLFLPTFVFHLRKRATIVTKEFEKKRQPQLLTV